MARIVAFHAHPDDEALLTGGTLARLSAEGHRVVIVVACDGVVRPDDDGVGPSRLDELRASAAVLGAAGVVHLGYADSGYGPVCYPDPPGRVRFARADLGEAARRLAALLREEQADVLISYDRQGGYGHRDHVQVHRVGARAAELATVRVLEATRPREPIRRLIAVLGWLGVPIGYDRHALASSYSPRVTITHRVDVRRYAGAKRAALAAHRSQLHRGRASIALRMLVRLPGPLFGLVLGREWFIEPGAIAPSRPIGDILRPGRYPT